AAESKRTSVTMIWLHLICVAARDGTYGARWFAGARSTQLMRSVGFRREPQIAGGREHSLVRHRHRLPFLADSDNVFTILEVERWVLHRSFTYDHSAFLTFPRRFAGRFRQPDTRQKFIDANHVPVSFRTCYPGDNDFFRCRDLHNIRGRL